MDLPCDIIDLFRGYFLYLHEIFIRFLPQIFKLLGNPSNEEHDLHGLGIALVHLYLSVYDYHF